jgi:hypothetical protein
MTTETIPPVFDGLTLDGTVNVTPETIRANIRSAIRRGHPQVWLTKTNGQRVALVGGGPSLESTFEALKRAVFEGAKLVTVNGAYQWCLDRNLQPKGQIILDARPSNARFVQPEVPECRYWICSQCAPETWDAVEGRPFVGIWHEEPNEDVKADLDAYYLGNWHAIPGGTTVGTRAIGLLRTLGYLRFDLFGFDSCVLGDQHHGYPQPENDADQCHTLTIHPTGHPDKARTFRVAGWHIKQLEDLILMIRANGDKFALNFHGDGLLAYALSSSAEVSWTLDDKESR